MKIHRVDLMAREALEKECELGWLFKKFIFEHFGEKEYAVLAGNFMQWMAEKGLVEEEANEEN